MMKPGYYREQASLARRLARGIGNVELIRHLDAMARDFDELADDIDDGAIGVRHPERLSPKQRK
jgi:hypothetical protein